MKFGFKNRWTGAVQFECELPDEVADASYSVKLGFAARKALDAGANLVGANLAGANLADADLARADLVGANLAGANLAGADLAGADLTGADLTCADLRGAVLAEVVLPSAVLTEVPTLPHIDAAILAAIEAGGALEMRNWHRCNTTHCRAGWAITLAGAEGAALERKMGSAVAGALIYAASRPGKPIPNFYASNENAMADLLACAAADPLPE